MELNCRSVETSKHNSGTDIHLAEGRGDGGGWGVSDRVPMPKAAQRLASQAFYWVAMKPGET